MCTSEKIYTYMMKVPKKYSTFEVQVLK